MSAKVRENPDGTVTLFQVVTPWIQLFPPPGWPTGQTFTDARRMQGDLLESTYWDLDRLVELGAVRPVTFTPNTTKGNPK